METPESADKKITTRKHTPRLSERKKKLFTPSDQNVVEDDEDVMQGIGPLESSKSDDSNSQTSLTNIRVLRTRRFSTKNDSQLTPCNVVASTKKESNRKTSTVQSTRRSLRLNSRSAASSSTSDPVSSNSLSPTNSLKENAPMPVNSDDPNEDQLEVLFSTSMRLNGQRTPKTPNSRSFNLKTDKSIETAMDSDSSEQLHHEAQKRHATSSNSSPQSKIPKIVSPTDLHSISTKSFYSAQKQSPRQMLHETPKTQIMPATQSEKRMDRYNSSPRSRSGARLNMHKGVKHGIRRPHKLSARSTDIDLIISNITNERLRNLLTAQREQRQQVEKVHKIIREAKNPIAMAKPLSVLNDDANNNNNENKNCNAMEIEKKKPVAKKRRKEMDFSDLETESDSDNTSVEMEETMQGTKKIMEPEQQPVLTNRKFFKTARTNSVKEVTITDHIRASISNGKISLIKRKKQRRLKSGAMNYEFADEQAKVDEILKCLDDTDYGDNLEATVSNVAIIDEIEEFEKEMSDEIGEVVKNKNIVKATEIRVAHKILAAEDENEAVEAAEQALLQGKAIKSAAAASVSLVKAAEPAVKYEVPGEIIEPTREFVNPPEAVVEYKVESETVNTAEAAAAAAAVETVKNEIVAENEIALETAESALQASIIVEDEKSATLTTVAPNDISNTNSDNHNSSYDSMLNDIELLEPDAHDKFRQRLPYNTNDPELIARQNLLLDFLIKNDICNDETFNIFIADPDNNKEEAARIVDQVVMVVNEKPDFQQRIPYNTDDPELIAQQQSFLEFLIDNNICNEENFDIFIANYETRQEEAEAIIEVVESRMRCTPSEMDMTVDDISDLPIPNLNNYNSKIVIDAAANQSVVTPKITAPLNETSTSSGSILATTATETSIPNTNQKSDKLFPIFYPDQFRPLLQGTTRKMPRTWNAGYGANQLQIDAGQKQFGAKQCKYCGLVYTAHEPEEEKVHRDFHSSMFVLRFKGWIDEDVLSLIPEWGSDGRILRITDTSAIRRQERLLEVLKIVDKELGFSSYIMPKVFVAYLAVRKCQIIGLCLVQPLQRANKYLCINGVDCCTEEEFEAKCGISRIWVSPLNRRHKVASKLLQTVQIYTIIGEEIPMDKIAFSAPTQIGKIFAQKVTQMENFLVYQ